MKSPKSIQEHLKQIEYGGQVSRTAAILARKKTSTQARLTENDLISLFSETLVKCSKEFKAEKGASFKTYLGTALQNAYKNALDDSMRQGGVCLTDVSRPEGEGNPVEDVLISESETRIFGRKAPAWDSRKNDLKPPKQNKATLSAGRMKRLEKIRKLSAEDLLNAAKFSHLIFDFYEGGARMRRECPEMWSFLQNFKQFECALCGDDIRTLPIAWGKNKNPALLLPTPAEIVQRWRDVRKVNLVFCQFCASDILEASRAANRDSDDDL